MEVMGILHLPFSCVGVTNEIDMENNGRKGNHERPTHFVYILSCCFMQALEAFAVQTENCSFPKN
jgi:hypothetical protein